MERQKPIYYSILPSQVRYDKNLSANEKILYSEIVVLAQKKGYCFAQNRFFEEVFSVSKSSVIRWIKNLEKLGYIKCELTYIEDTKWITGRKIYPKKFEEEGGAKSSPGFSQNDNRAGKKNATSPGFKNDTYNNTRYINTSMNNTRRILASFNTLGGRVELLEDSYENLEKIGKLLDTYGEKSLERAIEEIRKSKFLRGEVSDFVINLTYLEKPANMEKITAGKYRDFDNNDEVFYESPYQEGPYRESSYQEDPYQEDYHQESSYQESPPRPSLMSKVDYLQKLLDEIE